MHSDGNLYSIISCNLLSVKKLVHAFSTDIDEEYAKVFKEHIYIGLVNIDNVLIQYGTCILMC